MNIPGAALCETSPVSIPNEDDKIVFSLRGRVFTLPRWPIILILLHTAVFILFFYLKDLPVSDDVNYFGNAKSFARSGANLYGDWSPILIYFAALIYKLIPLPALYQFLLFSYFVKLIFLLGVYRFIVQFTNNRSWAFYSTIWVGIALSYFYLLYAHSFAAGITLILLAWMYKKKSLDLWTAAAIASLSILLRTECVLPTVGFAGMVLWRRYREGSWRALLRPTRHAFIFAFAACLAWGPLLYWGTLSSNHLPYTFAQKFSIFAKLRSDFKDYGLQPSDDWFTILDKYFPPEKRDAESFLGKRFELYSIASANPPLYASFLWGNFIIICNGNFGITESHELNPFLNLFMQLGLISFLFLLIFHRPREGIANLYLTIVFLFSFLPCLITNPYCGYALPSLVWFLAVLPYFLFSSFKPQKTFWASLILLTLAYQYSPIHNSLKRQDGKNWNRYRFLQKAQAQIDLKGAVIAEAWPVFSVAFTEEAAISVDYALYRDPQGSLRAYNQMGPIVHYVLWEEGPYPIPPNTIQSMKQYLNEQGELLLQDNSFSLYKIHPKPSAAP